MAVEPENRLVARTLEDAWHEQLEQLAQAKAACAKRRAKNPDVLDEQKPAAIRRIATDLPSLWSHPATSMQDKKRLVRLLIEDGTLQRHQDPVELCMRLKAGALRERTVRLSGAGNKPTVLDPAIITQIDALTERHTAGEVAAKLNPAGVPPPTRGDFDTNAVVYLLQRFQLPSRYHRLRSKGYMPQEDIAETFGVNVQTVQRWRKKGRMHAEYDNGSVSKVEMAIFTLAVQRHSG
jgi:hypothetical protein